jgi:activating signal cointegrator complex subunit 3
VELKIGSKIDFCAYFKVNLCIFLRLKLIARKRELDKLPVRLVGLSTALANAADVADWLGIKEEGLYNFRPNVRPVPIQVHIQGFPGQHYCPRMALMNKPAFKAIKEFSPIKPTLLFVASRRQTRLTAMAFVSMLAMEDDPKQWLHIDMQEVIICKFRIWHKNFLF